MKRDGDARGFFLRAQRVSTRTHTHTQAHAHTCTRTHMRTHTHAHTHTLTGEPCTPVGCQERGGFHLIGLPPPPPPLDSQVAAAAGGGGMWVVCIYDFEHCVGCEIPRYKWSQSRACASGCSAHHINSNNHARINANNRLHCPQSLEVHFRKSFVECQSRESLLVLVPNWRCKGLCSPFCTYASEKSGEKKMPFWQCEDDVA